MRIACEAHTAITGAEQCHDPALGSALEREYACEQVIAVEVRDEGKPASDAVATGDSHSLERKRLDAGKKFHRIGEASPAKATAAGGSREVACTRRRIVRSVEVPDQRVLAPRAEGG